MPSYEVFERFQLHSLERRRYSVDSKLTVYAVTHGLILRDALADNNRDYVSIFEIPEIDMFLKTLIFVGIQKCSSRRILDEACEAVGVALSIPMELSSIEVVKNFVSINSGISVVPELAVKREVVEKNLIALKIRDLHVADPIKMYAIYKKDRYLALAARSFLKMLQSSFRLSATNSEY